jgi:sn-glycerol 3-phosphate transport system substrate-binding protein
MKSRPAAEQEAAWNFIQYAMSPAVQAQWQADTGYYSARRSAQDQPAAQQWTAQFPQFTTALNEIEQAPQNRITQGAVLGVFPQARSRIQTVIESVLLGQSDSQAALDAAAEDINRQIQTYNKSVGS